MNHFTGNLISLSDKQLGELEYYAFPENITRKMVNDFCSKVNLLINLKHLSIAGFLTPNKYGPLLLSKIPVLTKLQGLNCSNCCLKDLSPIMCLTNLKYLFCCWNELTSLPVDIGVLCNLKTLDCYHNNLTSFPSSLYELKNLKILNVNWNKFKSFPFDIELLKNLEQFYIHYNQFDSSFYF